MKCPRCEHEFGYLHLEGTEEALNQEFNCPNCDVRLNANPIVKIMNKNRFYSRGGLLSVISILGLGYLSYGDNLPIWLGVMLVPIYAVFLSLSFLEQRKVNSNLYYEEIVKSG